MNRKITRYKLVVLGDTDVGKTSLIMRLCCTYFPRPYDPTVEEGYEFAAFIDGKRCTLDILDTGGDKHYVELQHQWIRDSPAYVLVYSVTSRDSFKKIQDIHAKIQRAEEEVSRSLPHGSSCDTLRESPSSRPVILVGNKIDKRNERAISTQEGQALAKELGCQLVETSAKNQVHVEKPFYDIARALRSASPEIVQVAAAHSNTHHVRTPTQTGVTAKSITKIPTSVTFQSERRSQEDCIKSKTGYPTPSEPKNNPLMMNGPRRLLGMISLSGLNSKWYCSPWCNTSIATKPRYSTVRLPFEYKSPTPMKTSVQDPARSPAV